MSVKLLTEHHLDFLSLKGGCTGSSEPTLVKMLHCWKSHVTAQLSTLMRLSAGPMPQLPHSKVKITLGVKGLIYRNLSIPYILNPLVRFFICCSFV